MSGTLPANEPACTPLDEGVIELLVEGRARDLGGFAVRRVLPSMKRRLVGPFIFFDHMGPATLAPGEGFDVRPHPHIGLATVTYLFEGAIDHRDSIGSIQTIRPGDVNWMVAGRGIAHSERSPAKERSEGPKIHGIQSWVALPLRDAETTPRFAHHPASTIPKIEREGVVLDVIAGTAYGATSPVEVLSPTLYVHACVDAGGRWELDAEHDERAVYVVEGSFGCAGHTLEAGTMAIFRKGAHVVLEATTNARAFLVGGARIDGERHIWWNFIASTQERIDQAKDDWKNQRFAAVPGETEFIPLPER